MLVIINLACELVCSCPHNKYHRLGGLNDRNFSSRSSGSWKSQVKVLAGLIFSWSLSPGLVDAVCPLCLPSHGLFSVRVCVLISFYKDTSPWIRVTLMTSFTLVTFLKALSPRAVTFGGVILTYEFCRWYSSGHNSAYNRKNVAIPQWLLR